MRFLHNMIVFVLALTASAVQSSQSFGGDDLLDSTGEVLLTSNQVFTLSPIQSNALNYLFQGTVTSQRGKGNLKFETATVRDFLLAINIQWGTMPENLKSSLLKLPTNRLSPVRGWLSDNGFHPFLAIAFTTLLVANQLPSEAAWVTELSKEKTLRGSQPELVEKFMKSFFQAPYRVPTGYSDSSNPALGSLFGGATLDYLSARSFNLAPDGRPLVFEPTLESLLTYAAEFKQLLLLSGQTFNSSMLGRVREHFTSQAKSFELLWGIIEDFETSVVDLQGLLDTIRYKMALPETNTQHELTAFNKLLSESNAIKQELARTSENFFGALPNGKEASGPIKVPSMAQLNRRLNSQIQAMESIRRKIKSFETQAIDRMEVILGLNSFSENRLQFDTPWEIAFQMAHEEAKEAGLANDWDAIRTF